MMLFVLAVAAEEPKKQTLSGLFNELLNAMRAADGIAWLSYMAFK